MTLKKYILLILLISTLSCIEEIDLNIDNDQTSIVVDGLISTTEQEYTIRVRNSAILGVGTDNILTPISGAQVKVINTIGNEVEFLEKEDEPGSYVAVTKTEVGESYALNVQLADGTVISSEFIQVLPPSSIDTLAFDITNEQVLSTTGAVTTKEFVNVRLTTDFSGEEKPKLRWRMLGVYEFMERYPMAFNPRKCYVRDNIDINRLITFDGSVLNGEKLNDQLLFKTELNTRFNRLYAFTAIQYRLSDEEFDYWKDIDLLVNIDGTLFDPPPASIAGNLRNETDPNQVIQGYFSVVSETVERLFIDVSTQGVFVDTNCRAFPGRFNPAECSDCTLIINSSLIKPEYWPF